MNIKIKHMVKVIGCIMMLLKPMVGDAQSVVGRKASDMSFDPKHFRELIVRPALHELNMWSESAEELLMLTAAIESELGTYLRQVGSGGGYSVARGIFQMEPQTFEWLKNIPVFNNLLHGTADDMIYDLKLATKAARLRYKVVPTNLPAHDDLKGLASYWKKWYNASPNGGSVDEAIKKYKKYVY